MNALNRVLTAWILKYDPVVHVSCDRLLECRSCAFWRYVCMCSLNQSHRGGARRLGDGLQNCFKRVRLPSPRPINIIIMKHGISRIIALIMIDLTSLHSCDIIVFVMNENDVIRSYASNVDALDILRSSTIGSCI